MRKADGIKAVLPEESPAETPDPGENMCCWCGEGSGTLSTLLVHLPWDRLCARASISSFADLHSKPEAGGLIKFRFTDKGNVAPAQGWQASSLGFSHSSVLLLSRKSLLSGTKGS